jgi:L-ribulose-5-phosphate 3-epimerase
MKTNPNNPVGIMQGRLSPPVSFRLQAFPTGSWKKEFENARSIGLDTIEWLFEAEDGRGHTYLQNPLWNEAGRIEINQAVETSRVQVRTCCADYFMPHPFFRVTEAERFESIAILLQLIENVSQIGVQSILLPVLEISEIRTKGEKELLLESLKKPLDLAAKKNISLGLETELPAEEYLELIVEAHHPALGVYYDTGNNAAQGHDITEDAGILAPHLVGVHIKDRKKGGGTVFLGQGDADFDGFLSCIKANGYEGPVILQTAFGEDYMGIALQHKKYIQVRLNRDGS